MNGCVCCGGVLWINGIKTVNIFLSANFALLFRSLAQCRGPKWGKKRLTEMSLRITINVVVTVGMGVMRMWLMRKILSCIMLVIVPSAVFAADAGAAMLYSNGPAWLNGSKFPKSSAIFPGDLVQTGAGVMAKINAAGTSLLVLSDSLVQFDGSTVNLNHGGVTVSTSKTMAARAGHVTVTPATSAWTQFEVTSVDGRVLIAARKGDLTIDDASKTTTLAEGQQTTRDQSENNQPNAQDESEKKKKKKKVAAAVPAAEGGILNSPVAVAVGAAAIAGVTTWVLVQGDEPVSPVKP